MGKIMHGGIEYGAGSGNLILYGTTDPNSLLGTNGTLYLKYDSSTNKIIGIYCKINDIWMPFQSSNASIPILEENNIIQENITISEVEE